MMTLAHAFKLIPGATLVGDGVTPIHRVHTDTRTIEPGDLFVALQGERFDANDMLHEAFTKGAAAVICHAGLAASAYPAGLPRIEVSNSKQALAALATGWRAQFDLPVIAVTGSNGKTTVTQMIASILHAHAPDGAALATVGNFNNDIGVPLTLLRMRAPHRIAVVELGMNHPGEIAVLAAMAQPTVALVNNAQREHLEFMHTIEAVARENGSVLSSLPEVGTAHRPGPDRCQTGPVLSREQLARSVVSGRGPRRHRRGRSPAAGVPAATVVRGLEAFVPVKGRCRAMQVRQGALDFTLVDDTYNANPDSMRAAIDVLADLPGPRLLVMGDMGEVGEQGPAFHAEAGRYARDAGIEHVLALGDSSAHAVQAMPGARHFKDVTELNAAAMALAPAVASVLVKGSRFMRMERVVEALSARPVQEVAGHA
ncbi:MAG: UDP-N-acetylmuramoylalanyl-D-glutamyl-2, 6-diaminopimelate--D-alanyl-D-alanine ligase [Betaproteobacteria bacterium]|nr:UDP-N-acetylmuramoylalanyl-D-glutamyl-2, 6-diaminopimelate--D-alanyl-D-alanine ligase [Betaproteobacteria bacterium]